MGWRWPRLPGWAVEKAPPLTVAELERVESLAGLRTLIALHLAVGFSDEPGSPPSVVVSTAELASWSGLGRTSVQKAVSELERRDVIRVAAHRNTRPRVFTLHRMGR